MFSGRHERRKVTDWVYEEIREAIIDLRLPPGEPLREAAIAAQLGVSKTPVREALARLEQEGLVETTSFKGAVVSEYSPRDLEEIYELRELLEGAAARAAAAGRPPRRRWTRLQEIVARSRDLRERVSSPSSHRCSVSSISSMYDQVTNQRMSALIDNLRAHLTRIGKLTEGIPGRVVASVEEHAAIVEAIVRRRCRRCGTADAGAPVERPDRSAGAGVGRRRRWGDLGDDARLRRCCTRRAPPRGTPPSAHPMVPAIADGSLPHETFRRYFEQNVLYLEDYARAIGLIMAKAPDRDAIAVLVAVPVPDRGDRDPGEPGVPRSARRDPTGGGSRHDAADHLCVHPASARDVRAGGLRRGADGGAALSVELRRACPSAHGASARGSDLRGLDLDVRQRRVRRARRRRRPRCWTGSRRRRRRTGWRRSTEIFERSTQIRGGVLGHGVWGPGRAGELAPTRGGAP